MNNFLNQIIAVSKSLIVVLIAILVFLPVAETRAQNESRELLYQFSADESFLVKRYRNSSSIKEIDRLLEFYSLWQTLANQTTFTDMAIDQQIDVVLLLNYTRRKKYEYGELRLKRIAAGSSFPFLNSIDSVLDSYDGEVIEDSRKLAGLINRAAGQIEEFNIKSSEQARSKNPHGILDIAHFSDEAQRRLTEFHRFHVDRDPLYSWWVSEPIESLQKKLSAFSKVMHNDALALLNTPKIIQAKAIGREQLDRSLELDMIGCTVAQIISMADSELEWCEAEMDQIAKESGSDNGLAILAEISSKSVQPGEKTRFIQEKISETLQFIDTNNLVTIPRVARETSNYFRERSATSNLTHGFHSGGAIDHYQPIFRFSTSNMDYSQKLARLKEANPFFLKASVAHQFVPGHHLQNYMNRRFYPHRAIFSTSVTTEGWAAYWERILYDLGFAKSPEEKIGLLQSRKRYCVLAIISLKFHSSQMTPEEAVSFIREKLAMDQDSAAVLFNEIITYHSKPLYNASFLIGSLQYRKLREELVDSGKMTNREFHDTILKENNIPVEILRAKLTNASLKPNYETTWQFVPNASN